MKLFFSYSPLPGIHPPPPPTPPRSKSISSRFSVVFESVPQNRLKSDSKMTEKRHEIDSLGGGSVVVGDESRRVGCS